MMIDVNEKNKTMNIIITMAGRGQRFREAGYNLPKYMILVNGHTLFYWSMQSLIGLSSKEYFFIVRKEDKAVNFIQTECKKLGVIPKIIELEYLTKGQAETAMFAKPYWRENEQLFIYNIDTYVEAGNISDNEFKGDGFIPCFISEGNHWSFVRLNNNGEAIEVREKNRISDYCSLGAYYFRSAHLFETLYNEYYSDENLKLEMGERYIAPLYNYLIEKKGGKVYISVINSEYVHVLGTPEEVCVFSQLKGMDNV